MFIFSLSPNIYYNITNMTKNGFNIIYPQLIEPNFESHSDKFISAINPEK
jgi:hypothetical protein